MPDLDDQLRSYAAWLADRADVEAVERAAAPIAVVQSARARHGGWMIGAAAAAVAVLIAGLVLLTWSSDDVIPVPPATEPTASVASLRIDEVSVGGGMIVPVVGDAVTVDGVDVHQGAASTEDVSELLASLGGEPVDLSLEPVAASEFPIPVEFTDRRPDAVAVIGSRDDVAVAVHGRREAVGDVRCALLVSLETGSWLDACGGGSLVGTAGVLGSWVVWADLPEETAVVVVVDADRQPVAYQQPTGRAVAFTGTPIGTVMRAYDAAGRVLDEQANRVGSDVDTPVPTTPTVDEDPSPATTRPDPASPELIVEPAVDAAAALTGWNWAGSGIKRACGDVWSQQQGANERRCTQVVIDPHGIPVSFDPLTRRVTRERRADTEPIAFTLPDEYVDPSLLAAGPDDVVYFALANDWPSPSDVVALSLAPGDMGRMIERFPAVLPIGDADILSAPTGLVVSGWYDQGLRPSSEEIPVVAWVDRDGGVPSPIPLGAFDDANNRVGANGWQWYIDDRRVIPEQPGSSAVMPTFDGGFIAAYSETTGAMRTELIRGWRDGSVGYVELPLSWTALDGPLVLEPQGTLLVPNGESFARMAPFANPATGWESELQIDVVAATATPIGLDEYLDTIDWPTSGQSHVWPWGTSPIAFANAVAGGSPASPSELRTIQQGPVDGSTVVVTVTTEGFLDDSVHGTRLTMHISLDQPGFRIMRIEWSNTCQPDRGHQDYKADYCT